VSGSKEVDVIVEEVRLVLLCCSSVSEFLVEDWCFWGHRGVIVAVGSGERTNVGL
jgi:hypothetical protein